MSTSEEHDEYLWSKSGPADPEVERLEALLGRYRHVPAASPIPLAPARAARFPFGWALAAAAVLAVVGAGAWIWSRDTGAGYRVDGLAGLSRLFAGDEFEAREDVRVEIGALGDVSVRAGSRMRVEDDGEKHHRLFLEEGKLSARIFARPRLFQIGTPAGLSVDLGCRYDLEVDAEGLTHLAVTSGRVAFETDGRKVLVPEGAACDALPGRGPNTPVFLDADARFVQAVREVEYDAEPDAAAVEQLTSLARREDSLSLFHLLDAPSRSLRERVYERLSVMYELPDDATREGLVEGNAAMRLAWREEMDHDWR